MHQKAQRSRLAAATALASAGVVLAAGCGGRASGAMDADVAVVEPAPPPILADAGDPRHSEADRIADEELGAAWAALTKRDAVMADIDRRRTARERNAAFEAGLARADRRTARLRVRVRSAELGEENHRLRAEIERAKQRGIPTLFRVAFSLGVRIFVTALTGNPIAGAAVSGAISGLMDGDGIENVLASAALSAGTTFVGDEIAVAVAGGDWDAAGTLEQVLGAGAAGGATGAGVAIVRGESAEDVVAAAAMNMGIAMAAEVITGAVLDESSGEDVTDDGTVLVTRTRSALRDGLQKLGIETVQDFLRLPPAGLRRRSVRGRNACAGWPRATCGCRCNRCGSGTRSPCATTSTIRRPTSHA